MVIWLGGVMCKKKNANFEKAEKFVRSIELQSRLILVFNLTHNRRMALPFQRTPILYFWLHVVRRVEHYYVEPSPAARLDGIG